MRTRTVHDLLTGETTTVAFTPAEEAERDAFEAAPPAVQVEVPVLRALRALADEVGPAARARVELELGPRRGPA